MQTIKSQAYLRNQDIWRKCNIHNNFLLLGGAISLNGRGTSAFRHVNSADQTDSHLPQNSSIASRKNGIYTGNHAIRIQIRTVGANKFTWVCDQNSCSRSWARWWISTIWGSIFVNMNFRRPLDWTRIATYDGERKIQGKGGKFS